ncbi:MAG TPA: tetratricopeptide repeat protein [Thermodesulfobacteriota bacterium]
MKRKILMDEDLRNEEEKDFGAPGKDSASSLFIPQAEALRAQGRHDEAIQTCKDGLETTPDVLPGRLLLGKCYLEKGMIAEARKELERVAEVVEECLSVYKLLSKVYLEEKDVDKALEVLRKTLYFPPTEEGPPKKVTPLEMGMLHRGSRPPFATPPAFQKPAQPPQTPVTAGKRPGEEEEKAAKPAIPTDTMAEIYLKQGHPDRALLVYQDILAKDPHNAMVKEKYESLKNRISRDQKTESRQKVQEKLEKWLGVVSSKG